MVYKIINIFLLTLFFLSTAHGGAKMSDQDLKKKLTTLQYKVTQKDGTEPPFKNEYWDNKKEGLYVDIVSGEVLFSSKDKFDSGTGWPSFTRPVNESQITLKSDRKLFFKRTEVRSKIADSHLGHVFDDGPQPTGKRYCINSAALKFVAKENLKKEGYQKYLHLFEPKAKDTQKNSSAILAGGCFWGIEELIRKQPGVLSTEVGYTGGTTKKPTYNDIKTGTSGHAEAIKISYDPQKTTYEKLLRFFFRMHDPTTLNQQGNDKGTQYRSAIFYQNDEQKKVAQSIVKKANESGLWKKPIVTEVTLASSFYPAEDYHQDYLQKVPNGYTCHFVRPIDF